MRFLLALFSLFYIAFVAGNKVDLCITDTIARECQIPSFYGAYKNKQYVEINTQRISVANYETGRSIQTLEVPGKYRLTFGEVTVKEDLEYLIADMELTLRTPVYPSINILNDCDGRSHQVSVDGPGSGYCRYCDLCELTQDIEQNLERKSVLAFSNAEAVRWDDGSCEKLKKGRTYAIARYIDLPEPSRFKERYGASLDDLLASALNGGEGSIEAQLRLLSTKSQGNQDFNKQECINSCIKTKSTAVCIGECSGRESSVNQQNFRDIFKIEGAKCEASTGYLNGYDLATCLTVEFKFKATERPPGATAPVCANSPDFNPCKGQRRECCRQKQTHLMSVFQCTQDCMDYRGNCKKLYANG